MQQRTHSAQEYIEGIRNRDKIMLSKAITLIESTRQKDIETAHAILKGCLHFKSISKRIAITGSPGAGKSTFINAFAKLLTDEGKTIAVLAIDPSSSYSKGSILGDKTRMEDIVNRDDVFIRPTANRNVGGGVAGKTREAIILCEAAGYDYIFVETVGVGQSETQVKNMTDLFILLLLPNAGDELQGIKRGIMEMADIILINKSEVENKTVAQSSAAQVKASLHFQAAAENGWIKQVLNISSIKGNGLDELKALVESYFLKMESSGFLSHNRDEQQLKWMEDLLLENIRTRIDANNSIRELRDELSKKLMNHEIDASEAAALLSGKLFLGK